MEGASIVTYKPERICQAVSILRKLNSEYYTSSVKKPLLEDVSAKDLFLQITMKKIPPTKLRKFIKIRLPHGHVTSNEVCLITRDIHKNNTKAETEPDVLYYKEHLKRKGIKVDEVITLRQLRKEYKPFEARRKLAAAYDIFLCDKKIFGVLPHTLGKHFFERRKMPIQINLTSPNLKDHINNACSSTVFNVTGKGNSCSAVIGNLSMKDDDLIKNISTSIEVLIDLLPFKDNILGMYLKTPKSKSLPLFMSFDT